MKEIKEERLARGASEEDSKGLLVIDELGMVYIYVHIHTDIYIYIYECICILFMYVRIHVCV
jgi:hypothetical protein